MKRQEKLWYLLLLVFFSGRFPLFTALSMAYDWVCIVYTVIRCSLFSANNSFAFLWRFTVIFRFVFFYVLISESLSIGYEYRNDRRMSMHKIKHTTEKKRLISQWRCKCLSSSFCVLVGVHVFCFLFFFFSFSVTFPFFFHLHPSKSILYQTLIYRPISNKSRWLRLFFDVEWWTRSKYTSKNWLWITVILSFSPHFTLQCIEFAIREMKWCMVVRG